METSRNNRSEYLSYGIIRVFWRMECAAARFFSIWIAALLCEYFRTHIRVGLFSVREIPFRFHGWYRCFEGRVCLKSRPNGLILHSIKHSKPNNHTKFVYAAYSRATEWNNCVPYRRLLECVVFQCGIFIPMKCEGAMSVRSVSWLDNGFVSLSGQKILLAVAFRLTHTASFQWKVAGEA